MRAAVRGGPITFGTDVPVPSPAAGQLLIRVMAASINPVDYKLPKFVAGKGVGLDVAGVVDAVGPGVEDFAAGDEVFGFAQSGSVAEYAVCDAIKLARKPAELSWAAAAALPTAHLTSYQSLLEVAPVRAGAAVLIIGASGGCGLAGVRLAKALGAGSVVGVCSAANSELVRAQGATRVVDYKSGEEYAALRGGGGQFDVVYDCASGSGAGEDYEKDGGRMLRPGGVQVAINGGLGSWLRLALKWQSKSRRLMLTRQNGAQLAEIVALLGGASPVIDSVHALSAEGVAAAFGRLKSRRARGKVVVEVGASCAAPE